MLTVAEVASHFDVTPQAVYKWRKAGKIDFEQTPGGGYRIPAAQFDWARGEAGRRAWHEIAERLLAKHSGEETPGDAETVASIREARRAEWGSSSRPPAGRAILKPAGIQGGPCGAAGRRLTRPLPTPRGRDRHSS